MLGMRLQIRQQEIAARKSVLANPVKMDAVKRQAELVAQQKAERKQAKKDAKAAKKVRSRQEISALCIHHAQTKCLCRHKFLRCLRGRMLQV